jgi:hypothetical protein
LGRCSVPPQHHHQVRYQAEPSLVPGGWFVVVDIVTG